MADTAAPIVAQTERLVLRGEAEGDLSTWLVHMNTPEVMARLGGVQSEQAVAESFARMRAQGDAVPGFWFVVRKADGMLIGKCGVSAIDSPAAPVELHDAWQVGWTLRADCWGQGYATEAARAALELAFGPFGAERVYGQTSESNGPSWRVMQRLGMTRLAALDYPDPDYPPEDNPTMVWALDRTDWRKSLADG